jgi:hypothetical protein
VANGDRYKLVEALLVAEKELKIREIDPKLLKPHPLAHLIPDMRASEWQDFYTDIGLRGIKVPLEVLGDGTVVDGRHRLKAALELGMKQVPVVDAPLNDDKPEVYMMKAAVLRRHLTDDQRKCMAVLWIAENKKQPPAPPPGPGRGHRAKKATTPWGVEGFAKTHPTKAKAAEDFKVSRKGIDKAEKVKSKAPDLFKKVHQGNITLSNAYKKMKELERQQNNKTAEISFPEGNNVISGPASLLEKELPDNYADLFFTDPPYAKESLNIYTELAKLAQAKLRPGGICLTYCPHPHLDKVIELMAEYLDYWWIFAIVQTGGQPRIWNEKIWASWKPVLAFTKRPRQERITNTWFCDSFRGAGEDKQYHKWGQNVHEATYFIEALCPLGAGLVVDPFCGGGTILVAAKLTGRKWLGIEIDPGYAAQARKRLEETPWQGLISSIQNTNLM